MAPRRAAILPKKESQEKLDLLNGPHEAFHL